MSKSKRIPLKERTLENDINYRAPLSYRYVRILAWVILIVVQFGMVAKINMKLVPSSVETLSWLKTMGDFLSNIPLPLFLLANFAIIFQKRNNWKSLLVQFGGIAALLYVVGNILIIHYGYGLVHAFIDVDFMTMANNFGAMLFGLGNSGLIFNIFIDLFLCALLFFFMNYTPKKLKGKQIYFFRALIALPILYEIASIVIKFHVAIGNMSIPFFLFFLLTSKPPFMFAAFLALVIILKVQDYLTFKKRGDLEFRKEHMKTNAHSFKFSCIIFIVFLSAGLLDFIVYFILGASFSFSIGQEIPEIGDFAFNLAQFVIDKMGFGRAIVLILVAPIALLFSYTKTHANKKLDPLVPIVGIALILFVYIEGVYQIIVHNVPAFIEKFFGGGDTEEASKALAKIKEIIKK